MGTMVYARISISLLESSPDFLRKLKRFVGDFRIEQQEIHDIEKGVMTVSFFSDKVTIPEGKQRGVDLEAKINKRGSWYFTGITPYFIDK